MHINWFQLDLIHVHKSIWAGVFWRGNLLGYSYVNIFYLLLISVMLTQQNSLLCTKKKHRVVLVPMYKIPLKVSRFHLQESLA